MSVAPLSTYELGLFAAVATHLKLCPFSESLAIAELLSISNCAAYHAQYGEQSEPSTIDDIEAVALNRLAKREFSGLCGPLIYNCITNEGILYVGECSAGDASQAPCKEISKAIANIEPICSAVENFIRSEARRIERQKENDEAYSEVEPLPLLTAEEIKQRMEDCGASRVIYAEFGIDETDIQTDYFGGRTSRKVIIGFGKGKRENFRQLRDAAGMFPPTSQFGPGLDIWTARVVLENDIKSNGFAHWRGCGSHWHDDMGNGRKFATKAEAEQFIDAAGKPHDIHFSGEIGRFSWTIEHESYEQRENYSIGGGNYLGTSRYGGWKVSSTTYPIGGEFFEAPKPAAKPARQKSQKPAVTPLPGKPLTIADEYAANV